MVFAVLILRPVIFAYRPRLLTLVWICLPLLEIRARSLAKSRSSRKLLNFHLMAGGLPHNPVHNKQEKKPRHTGTLFNTGLDLEPIIHT